MGAERPCVTCGEPLPADAHGRRKVHEGECRRLRENWRGREQAARRKRRHAEVVKGIKARAERRSNEAAYTSTEPRRIHTPYHPPN